jgi:hypothetical protein
MRRLVMQWGLTQTSEWTVDTPVPATAQTLSLVLEPERLRRVQEDAAAHRSSVAA